MTDMPAQAWAMRMISTPVGTMHLHASARGLTAVLWPRERPGRVPLAAQPVSGLEDAGPEHAILAAAEQQIAEYFAGNRYVFDLPLDAHGTPFQKQVWSQLAAIPFGETRTYLDIARQIGNPAAVRAVGAANGRNPISIIVPCHRVIGADGTLTGFAGGLDIKARLLAHEGIGQAQLSLTL